MWRMHKTTWLFEEYLIRLSNRGSYTTYLGWEAIKTWRHKSCLNWNWLGCADTLRVFFGDKELGGFCFLSPVFTGRPVSCLLLAFFLGEGGVVVCGEWYMHMFQGRGAKMLAPRCCTDLQDCWKDVLTLDFIADRNCSWRLLWWPFKIVCMCTIMWPVF